MKNRTVSRIVVILAAVLVVPMAHAQRGGGRYGGGGAPSGGRGAPPPQMNRPAPQSPTIVFAPSTPILPMTNPIAPMTNPVAPFVRYGGIPTVVFPSNRPVHTTTPDFRRRGGTVPVVVSGGFVYPSYPYAYPYDPFYTYSAYPGYLTPPPTIPGQLPNIPFPYLTTDPTAVAEPAPSAPDDSGPSIDEPVYFPPDPNMIITPPVPERTVPPPAIGTARADLLTRYGQPWGSFRIQNRETLYFNGGLELVLEDGRVSEIK